jgi:hypothetical protein
MRHTAPLRPLRPPTHHPPPHPHHRLRTPALRDPAALRDQAQTHLAAAFTLLRALSELPDRDHAALWWTARQADQTALEVLAADQAFPGPRQADLLRDAVGTARGTVESGKMAIYQTTGTRLASY